jgi:Flp pilus assembly protein TadG
LKPKQSLNGARRWRRGNVLITFALSLAIFIAAAGLGTEVAAWYAQRRDMQNAADLGVDSGIVSLAKNYPLITGANSAAYQTYGRNEASAAIASHGYANGAGDGAAVEVAVKPANTRLFASTFWDGAPPYGAVQATITKPAPLLFSGIYLSVAPRISVRATAALDYTRSICMLSLSPTQDMSVEIIGSSNLTLDCSIAVNSNNSGTNGHGQRNVALYVQGGAGAVLKAFDITVVGSWGGPGSATIQAADELNSPGSVTLDPYGPGGETPVTIPVSCGCLASGPASPTAAQVLSSGALSGGADILGDLNIGSTLTLSNGIYVVNGNINIAAGGNLVTHNATIVLNSTDAAHNYTFNMQSTQANVNLNAPDASSGLSTAGFALMQSRAAPTDIIDQNGNCTVNCSVIQGGPPMSITGVVYFPSGGLKYQGSPSGTGGCTQIIADTLQYQGGPLFVNECAGTGVTLFGKPHTFLAE